MSRVPLVLLALAALAPPLALAGGGGHATGPDAVQPGAVLDRAFNATGEFHYFCKPHPHMTGVIVVSDAEDALAGTVKVAVSNYSFKPDRVVVKPGAVVTWTNADDVAHTVTMKGGPYAEAATAATESAAPATDAAASGGSTPVVESGASRDAPLAALPLLVAGILLVALLRKDERRGGG